MRALSSPITSSSGSSAACSSSGTWALCPRSCRGSCRCPSRRVLPARSTPRRTPEPLSARAPLLSSQLKIERERAVTASHRMACGSAHPHSLAAALDIRRIGLGPNGRLQCQWDTDGLTWLTTHPLGDCAGWMSALQLPGFCLSANCPVRRPCGDWLLRATRPAAALSAPPPRFRADAPGSRCPR